MTSLRQQFWGICPDRGLHRASPYVGQLQLNGQLKHDVALLMQGGYGNWQGLARRLQSAAGEVSEQRAGVHLQSRMKAAQRSVANGGLQ